MSKPLKILHLGKYYAPFFGGIETFNQDLAEQQALIGHKVTCLVFHHDTSKPQEDITIRGVRVIRVPNLGQLMFAPISFSYIKILARVLHQFEPDIIHIHMPNTAFIYALCITKARNSQWILHWHSDVIGHQSPWFLKLFYPAYRFFERAALKKALRVIATSPNYLSSSLPLGMFKYKTDCIPLGLNTAHYALTNKLKIEGSQPIVNLLIVGRLTYYKGHHILLEAISLLENNIKQRVLLNIVGAGQEKLRLEAQVERLGIETNVTFQGKLDNEALASLYQDCDIFCLPSIERTEAFGVVLMEAAFFGLPAIVTDVEGSGMSWVVSHEQTGLVVPVNNSHALSKALSRLVSDQDTRERMGNSAKQAFKARFDIQHVAQRIDAVYEQALSIRCE